MNATMTRFLIPSAVAAATMLAILPCTTPAQTPPAAKAKGKAKAAASASAKAGSSSGLEVVGLQVMKPQAPAEPEGGDGSAGGMTMMMGSGGREGTTIHLAL